MRKHTRSLVASACLCLLGAAFGIAQPPPPPPGFEGEFRGGFPGPGPMMEEIKLVKQFDQDKNGWLNAEERKAARGHLASQPRRGPFGRGPGGMGRGGPQAPAQPGRKLAPADVKQYAGESLYDMKTLRTIFLEFEDADWDQELTEFHGSDVEVPAKLTVDGRTLAQVGVHYRGMTSFMMVPPGRKRSFNIAVDFLNKEQRVGGYRTLNLLNSAGDPTFLRTILYHEIARSYIPAPKANYVRVVVNGENWGVFVNVQQFNTDFVKEWFGTTKGARWKVPGSPRGRGGLGYLGDDPSAYKRIYEIKSKDDAQSWAALIRLCKTLNETPPEKLEAALAPMLDIEGALKFLAIDKALINTDGYWTRASDYNIYLDDKGKFHMIPHDANETMREAEGPGFGRFGGGGGEGGGLELDPFAGAQDPNKALLHRLLAVPSLRARYLAHVRDIAEKWLDWNRLGKLAASYQALIAGEIASDTKKLYSTEQFTAGVAGEVAESGGFRGPMGPPSITLKKFAEGRRAYLLNYKDVKTTIAAATMIGSGVQAE